jgi:dTDP-4-dehydrorhamnose 3,5-epimerase
MKLIETGIKDLYIIEPTIYEDKRGYFYESYNKRLFEENSLNYDFVQDNQSKSSYGVIRGLHYQLKPYAQAKLVRVLRGRVLDVVVDLRKDSDTFGKTFSVELSEDNHRQFLIPRGFAHGFSVLSNEAVFFYKCDNYYNKDAERGIIYNDVKLSIDWKIPEDKVIVSPKDLKNLPFDEAEKNF